jgi:hypothetical protein
MLKIVRQLTDILEAQGIRWEAEYSQKRPRSTDYEFGVWRLLEPDPLPIEVTISFRLTRPEQMEANWEVVEKGSPTP